MAEKFEDLVGDICTDHVIDISDGYSAAHDILGWLDENPEKVPARSLDLSEQDRIEAWHQVAKHPALEVCYRRMGNGKTFLRAVLDRLTELDEAAPMTVTESEVQDAYDIISSRGSFASYREFLFGLGFCITEDSEAGWPDTPGAVVKTTGKISDLEHLLVLGADGKWRSVGENRCVDPKTHPSRSHVLQEVVASA